MDIKLFILVLKRGSKISFYIRLTWVYLGFNNMNNLKNF
jgi:hypothetical protein